MATATKSTKANETQNEEKAEKIIKFVPQDKTVVKRLKELSDVRAGIVAKTQSLEKLIGESCEAIGDCYTGQFSEWSTKNDRRATYAAFLKYTVDPNFPQTRGDRAKGEHGYSYGPAEPLFWVMSTAMQKYKALKAVSERAIKVQETIETLKAKGMSILEATAKAEKEIPAIGGTGRTAATAGVDTPLKQYQKVSASCFAALSSTPRDLATTVLQSFGMAETGIKAFVDNVLPKQKGHPAIAAAIEKLAMQWVTEHPDAVAEFLIKIGYTVGAPIIPRASQPELVAAGPTVTRKRSRSGKASTVLASLALIALPFLSTIVW